MTTEWTATVTDPRSHKQLFKRIGTVYRFGDTVASLFKANL